MSLIHRMNRTRVAFAAASLALALLAGSRAMAEEGDTDVKSTDAYKKAEAYLKKVDEKIYSPFSNGLKTASFKVKQGGGRMGGSITATFTYDSSKEDNDEAWTVDLDLSEIPEQIRPFIEKAEDQMKRQLRSVGQWAIDTPYSFILRKPKAVEYTEDAEAKTVVIKVTNKGDDENDVTIDLNFNSETGLPINQVIHAGGQDITFATKLGEVFGKTLQTSVEMTFPQGTLNVEFKHDKVDGYIVPVSYTMKSPRGDQTIEFTDWVMNGKKTEVKKIESDEAALAVMRKLDGAYASMRDLGTGTVTFDMKMPGAGLQGSTCNVTYKSGKVSFDIDLTGAYARFKTQLMKTFQPQVESITKWVVGQKLADWETSHAVTFEEIGKSLRFTAKEKSEPLQAVVVVYAMPAEGVEGTPTIVSLTFTTADGATVTATPSGTVIANGALKGKIAMSNVHHKTPAGETDTVIAWSQPKDLGEGKFEGPFVTSVTMDGKAYEISNVKVE